MSLYIILQLQNDRMHPQLKYVNICEHVYSHQSLESKTAALPLAIAPFMASPASKYTRLRVRAWRSWTCLSRWHRRSMDPTANGFWDKDGKDWQMVHHTSTIKHSPYHNYNSILKPCSIVLIVSRLQRVFWCKIISNRNLLTRRPGSINTVAPSLLSGRISLFWSTWANTWGQDQPDLGVCLDRSGPASRSLKHAKNGYKMIRNNLHQFSVKQFVLTKENMVTSFLNDTNKMTQTTFKWYLLPPHEVWWNLTCSPPLGSCPDPNEAKRNGTSPHCRAANRWSAFPWRWDLDSGRCAVFGPCCLEHEHV